MHGVAIIAFGRAALLLLAISSMRVATEVLSTLEMGRMSVLMAVTTVCSVLFDRSIGAYWSRMVIPWSRDGAVAARFKTLAGFALGSGMAAVLAGGLVIEIMSQVVGGSGWWLAVILFVGVAGNGLFLGVSGALNLLGHRRAFVGVTLASAGSGLVLAAVIGRRTGIAEGWILGMQAGQCLALFAAVWILLGRTTASRRQAPRVDSWGEWLRFARPALLIALFYSAHLMGYRFVVASLGGPELVAMYTVAFGLGIAAMNAFDYFITQLLQPRFLRGIAGGLDADVKLSWERYADALVPSVVIMTAFVIAVAPVLLRLGASSRYGGAATLLAWGALVDSLRMIAQLFGSLAHAELRPQRLIVPAIIGTLSSLGLGLVLTVARPADGMAIGMAIGGGAWIAVTVYVVRARFAVAFPWRRSIWAVLASGGMFAITRLLLPAGALSASSAVVLLGTAGTMMALLQLAFARPWMGTLDQPSLRRTGLEVGGVPS